MGSFGAHEMVGDVIVNYFVDSRNVAIACSRSIAR
jgi:hypothetical protein